MALHRFLERQESAGARVRLRGDQSILGRFRAQLLLAKESWLAEPLAIALGTRLALFVLAFAAQIVIPFHPGSSHTSFPAGYFLDGWTRWDAGWYISIVRSGYSYNPVDHTGSVAFFPLYPIVVRLASVVVRNDYAAGIVVSNLAFAGAVVALYILVSSRFDRFVARCSALAVCAFPFGLFFSAVYTESLFLLLAVLAFLFAERKQWLLAGLAGLLCATTRSVGLALAPSLFLIYLGQARYHWRSFGWSILAPALVPIGTFAYMAYLYLRFQDPLAWYKAALCGSPKNSRALVAGTPKRNVFAADQGAASSPTAGARE